jgi:hypothetical protein
VTSTDENGPAERTLEPIRADALHVVLVGTAGWVIAVVVLLFARGSHDSWLWTALAGAGLGLLGIPLIAAQRRTAARRGMGNTDRD